MRDQYVYGVYDSVAEANHVAEQLIAGGVPTSSVSIIADDDLIEGMDKGDNVVELESFKEGKSLWKRITDLFDFDDSDDHEVDIGDYKKDLDAGKVIIAIQSEFEADAMKVTISDSSHLFAEDNPNRFEKDLQKGHARHDVNVDSLQNYDANDLSHPTSDFEKEMVRMENKNSPVEGSYTEAEMRRLKDTPRNDEFGGAIEVENPQEITVTDQEAQKADFSETEDVEEEMHPKGDLPPADEFGLNPDNVESRDRMEDVDEMDSAVVQQLDSEVGQVEEDMRRQSDVPPSDEFGVKPIDGDKSELLENEEDK